MKHNVDPALQKLLLPIDSLAHLPGNPRLGAIDAIKKSYETYGQVKPWIGYQDFETGDITIVAGNHQMEAAKALGWTHAAVLIGDFKSVQDALAFAIADNRTSELGNNDEDLLYEMLTQISGDHTELLDALEYDVFELTLMESYVNPHVPEGEDLSKGFVAPQILDLTTKEEDETLEADEETTRNVVTQGAEVVGKAGSERTSYNYSLVFESLEAQAEWYQFLKHLKGLPELKELSTSAQLLAFLKRNHDF